MSNKVYHSHHIIPKHMGGTDNPSNLVRLTVEEHADAHRQLYDQHGNIQDYLAWKGLSGMMGREEIIRQLISTTHKGKIVSDETKLKQRLAKLGDKNAMYGAVGVNRGKYGSDSPRWGYSHSEETKQQLSNKAKLRKKLTCEHCGKTEILPGHYGYYHKDGKCRK